MVTKQEDDGQSMKVAFRIKISTEFSFCLIPSVFALTNINNQNKKRKPEKGYWT